MRSFAACGGSRDLALRSGVDGALAGDRISSCAGGASSGAHSVLSIGCRGILRRSRRKQVSGAPIFAPVFLLNHFCLAFYGAEHGEGSGLHSNTAARHPSMR